MLFDSHCHLNDVNLYSKIDEIIRKSIEVGVTAFLVVGYDYSSSILAVEIAKKYPCCYASIGIHPSEIDSILNKNIDEFFKLALEEKVVAIGEIGLDYHYQNDEIEKNRQKEWFIKQINYANKYNLPVIIHSRDAAMDTLDILKKYKINKYGVLHCFSMSVDMMKAFLNIGFYIGLDGPITFKNAKTPIEICKEVPINRLLIETDSPYLTPTPYRGKENAPYYLPLIAEEVSKIKGLSYKEVSEITYRNTERLFLNKNNGKD